VSPSLGWWGPEAAWGWLAPAGPAPWPVAAFAAVTGACLGSFVNVVIHRLPRGQSLAWPGSHCPRCGHVLALWENIPLLSFALLRGRCRACRGVIAWRYPAVEALCAGLFAGAVLWLGMGPAALGAAAFAVALVAIAWIDAEHRIIPDELSAGLVAWGLWVRGPTLTGLAAGLAGALAGFLSLWAVAWIYRRVRGEEGLGGGDVKLAAGLGAFLGLPGLLLTLVGSAAAGSLVGLWLIARGEGSGRTALPYGAFLAPAALAVLVAGPALWRAYLSLTGLLP
jgi:leader peptidase (prepilin peptidase) / N-methyltransferase